MLSAQAFVLPYGCRLSGISTCFLLTPPSAQILSVSLDKHSVALMSYTVITSACKRQHILPHWLYSLAASQAATFHAIFGDSLFAASTTRSGYLISLVEASARVPAIMSRLPTSPYARRYSSCRAIFHVPGFCYARLFSDGWIIPAVTALGPYPAASDVARLASYFSPHALTHHYAIFASGSRWGAPLLHVSGVNRTMSYTVVSGLQRHGSSPVGSDHSMTGFPPLPAPNRVRFNPLPAHITLGRHVGLSPMHPGLPPQPSPIGASASALPPGPPPHYSQVAHPSAPPAPPTPVSLVAPAAQALPPRTLHSALNSSQSPQAFVAPCWDPAHPAPHAQNARAPRPRATPVGVSMPVQRQRRRAPSPAPFSILMPYNAQSWGRHSPPPALAPIFDVGRDAMDELLDQLKSSLTDMASDFADPLWSNFVTWLGNQASVEGFSRLHSLPAVREYFYTLSGKACAKESATAQRVAEDEALYERQEATGGAFAEAVARISALEDELADTSSARPKAVINAELDAARAEGERLDNATAALDLEAIERGLAPPESEVPDDANVLAASTPAPEVPVLRPWPESNYEGFEACARDAFAAPAGRVPIAELAYEVEAPRHSKLLLPQALELYTAEELIPALPKGVHPWDNCFEDPCEPVKPWSYELLAAEYGKHAYCFLLARVAQFGTMGLDPKLPKLRARLSE